MRCRRIAGEAEQLKTTKHLETISKTSYAKNELFQNLKCYYRLLVKNLDGNYMKKCYVLFLTNHGSKTPQSSNVTATDLPSQ